jgi:geranylgeranyl diphosphate synthase type II
VTTAPDQLRALVEEYLGGLELQPDLGELVDGVRYAFAAGGKRVRPVICLATGEAAGADLAKVLPAATALELVHSFSLVHDDLPALDNDELRRGQPSVWARFGEADAVLIGDALLAEAFRQALTYPSPAVASELAEATLGMIGGQHLDIHGQVQDLAELHRLKTGRLFAASVGCALWAAEVPAGDQVSWRAFGEELGLLFQIVDDVLDEDGYVFLHGPEGARALAVEAADRARDRLAAIDADTSTLAEIVNDLAVRTE